MTIEEILMASHGHLCSGNVNVRTRGISIDTRTLKPGEVFLAIKGRNYDGHSFITDAFKKGAAGVIVSRLPRSSGRILARSGCAVIRVKDTSAALCSIAVSHRDKFKLPIIAVTGSNGKTTTKEMLASILSCCFKTAKSPSSFNNELGVPLSLLRISVKHEICVLEIGMSAKGEILRLGRIVQPDIGVITNVGPSHLGNFKSMRDVADAKGELLEVVSDTCILNADDDFFGLLKRKCRAEPVTFGMKKPADFRVTSLRELPSGGFVFEINSEFEVRLPGPGIHNVSNAAAAIAAASCFDVSREDICRGLKKFHLPHKRCEIKKLGTITIINDTYNANPASMKYAVELLAGWNRKKAGSAGSKGRKILAAADMLELGKWARQAHEQMGGFIAASGIDILLTTGKDMKFTADAACKNGMKNVSFYKTKKGLIKKLLCGLKAYDTILVKGSRAMGMEEAADAVLSLPLSS